MIRSLLICLIFPYGCSADAEKPQAIASVDSPKITESSGLAASNANPGHLWIHNDSGDDASLYLIGLNGELKKTVKLRGAKSFDWEDMCSFTLNGKHWLLVGDVGDNARTRGRKTPGCELYLVEEKSITKKQSNRKHTWDVAATIKYKYQDGVWDCEGVAVDPQRREILLLTKGSPQTCGLYSLPLDISDSKQSLTASRIASPFIPFVTALDISPSGENLAVGTMLNGVIVKRQSGQSWKQAFLRPGNVIDLPPRMQGETICFDKTGRWMYLNSEGKGQPLWQIAVPEPPQ